MSSRSHNQDGRLESLKKQLALAVRSIQWSYAIIWSISPTQSGVLEWADGYYNGDIKTRKTVQSVEIDADQLGLQRSEQLRELYESLSAGETNSQARRPTAALSPEDLSETEWYYLVCMSFVFNIGRGLPGRTLAKGEPIWLSNAHYADSKVFSRSLLAKSASVKTVVCFPFSDGVVELGVTELVSEDPSLIQHIRTSFLDIPYPMSQKLNLRAPNVGGDKHLAFAEIDHDILDTKMISSVGCEELDLDSPGSCSNGNEFDNQNAEDLLMVEEQTVEAASQVHSWQLMDDDFSTCVYQPMNSSDCISQTLVNPATLVCLPDNERLKEPEQQVQDCNRLKVTALDLQTDVFHYQNVLSALLKTSHSLVLGPNVRNPHRGSSFMSWTKGGPTNCAKSKGATQQKLLKKILFHVPRMHASDLLESPEYHGDKKGIWTPEAGDTSMNHILAERKRRGKLNERFTVLRSIIPSINKVDKISILDDTIEYLQELERRVEELESSSREVVETEARTKWKSQEPSERTSGNYGNTIKTAAVLNKRKACDVVDETEQEMNCVGISADNLIVNVSDKDVVIKMRCPWREGLLLDIMDVVTNLHLDTHSVQSSTADGMLSVTIKSQSKRSTFASARLIKKELQRVASKY